jgi:hypothetical protein
MKPTKRQIIWYYLTLWRPVTKREFLYLQKNLVIILEGIKEGDLQHYQIEHTLENEIKRIIETKEKKKETKPDDNMFE